MLAYFKCGMIGHFVRDHTTGTIETTDNNILPVVAKCQQLLHLVLLTDGFHNILHINVNAAKKTYQMRQKIGTLTLQTMTTKVTTPAVTTQKVIIMDVSTTTTKMLASQNVLPIPQMKNVVLWLRK